MPSGSHRLTPSGTGTYPRDLRSFRSLALLTAPEVQQKAGLAIFRGEYVKRAQELRRAVGNNPALDLSPGGPVGALDGTLFRDALSFIADEQFRLDGPALPRALGILYAFAHSQRLRFDLEDPLHGEATPVLRGGEAIHDVRGYADLVLQELIECITRVPDYGPAAKAVLEDNESSLLEPAMRTLAFALRSLALRDLHGTNDLAPRVSALHALGEALKALGADREPYTLPGSVWSKVEALTPWLEDAANILGTLSDFSETLGDTIVRLHHEGHELETAVLRPVGGGGAAVDRAIVDDSSVSGPREAGIALIRALDAFAREPGSRDARGTVMEAIDTLDRLAGTQLPESVALRRTVGTLFTLVQNAPGVRIWRHQKGDPAVFELV